MTTHLPELLFSWALVVGSEVLLKASIVLGIAGLVTTFARRTSAASRHTVWTISLGALLVLPLLSATLPTWDIDGVSIVHRKIQAESGELQSAAGGAFAYAGTVEQRNASRKVVGSVPQSVGDSRIEVKQASPSPAPLGSIAATIAMAVWVTGVLLLLLRFSLAANRVRALSDRAIVGSSGDGNAKTIPLRSRFGVPKSVTVVSSDEVSMPMCWGLFRPVVILPAISERWPSDRKSAVMLHEIAHATRCDYLSLVVAEVARAIYWPNPLVWLAASRAATEREHACDDEALNVGMRSDVYAGHVLDVVSAQAGGYSMHGAIAMAGRSNFTTRMRKILAKGLSRRPVSKGGLLATGLGVALITVPIAAWDLSAVGETSVDPTNRVSMQGPRSIEERVRELRSNDASVRRYAAWALGEMEDERGVSPLHERLEDSDADVRLVSAWALGELKEDRSVDPLVELLNDDDLLVREMAVLALGEIEHARAIAPLMAAFERDERLVWPVIWALGEIDSFTAYEARLGVFESIGRRPWENTEVWAGEWHGWNGPERVRDLSTLESVLSDSDPETRQAAVWEIGHRDDERAVELLLDLLRDEDSTVRAMAIWALDETNPSRKTRRVVD
jgi:beta-lactamase regulating signal transducer with metallopeptidase domain